MHTGASVHERVAPTIVQDSAGLQDGTVGITAHAWLYRRCESAVYGMTGWDTPLPQYLSNAMAFGRTAVLRPCDAQESPADAGKCNTIPCGGLGYAAQQMQFVIGCTTITPLWWIRIWCATSKQ
jgi:hypothetical protein